ncbi:MAG TPA: VanW family protein [Gaiellaceae bacterium]|nr:VanW family protein [Gaiellaceae bacterium]
MSVRASTPPARVRRSTPTVRDTHLRVTASAAALVAAMLVVGLVFSGSPGSLAPGTRIDGVDVGGLSPSAAQAALEQRAAAVAHVPVTFTAGTHTFKIRPDELSVSSDWAQAIASAQSKGGGMDVIRGFVRLALRLNPPNITPEVRSYQAAVAYEIGVIASKVDRPYRAARLVRHGLRVQVIPGQAGERLDRGAAARIVVDALARLSRSGPVVLPTSVEQPVITGPDLDGARVVAEKVISAPVTVHVQGKTFQLSPQQLAAMLQLPTSKGAAPILGGAAADRFFAKVNRQVGRPARGASFAAYGDRATVIPAQAGLGLDVPRSAAAVLAAAESSSNRVARLVVSSVSVGRTTAAAQAMGITGLVSSYETEYGGVPNRIHNVELVAHLVDDKLIAPGATFSFNGATGARTAAKGFLEAPVIINGELQTGLGGGVCQVSTTVFNAAYEAGLPITARTNHALYISHYPTGRDATVDYPDVDLKFVNDTPHWLLLRTFVGPSSLVVSLYGTPQHRRVVSYTAPLRVVSPPPIERKLDRSLAPGTSVVEDPGEAAMSTSVRRLVYSPDGKLLSDATWYSSYRSSPEILLVGPKPKPKPKPKPAAATTPPPTTTPSGRVLQ